MSSCGDLKDERSLVRTKILFSGLRDLSHSVPSLSCIQSWDIITSVRIFVYLLWTYSEQLSSKVFVPITPKVKERKVQTNRLRTRDFRDNLMWQRPWEALKILKWKNQMNLHPILHYYLRSKESESSLFYWWKDMHESFDLITHEPRNRYVIDALLSREVGHTDISISPCIAIYWLSWRKKERNCLTFRLKFFLLNKNKRFLLE